MKKVFRILLYIWQLPQNIVGLIVRIFKRAEFITVYNDDDIRIYKYKFRCCASIGQYVFLTKATMQSGYTPMMQTLHHEIGHCRQSKILGWLWLPIIGIPSAVHNLICQIRGKWDNYYKFYTEAWADKLGGVQR